MRRPYFPIMTEASAENLDNADGAPLGPSPHETGSTKQPSLKPAASLNKGGRPKGKSKRHADLPRRVPLGRRSANADGRQASRSTSPIPPPVTKASVRSARSSRASNAKKKRTVSPVPPRISASAPLAHAPSNNAAPALPLLPPPAPSAIAATLLRPFPTWLLPVPCNGLYETGRSHIGTSRRSVAAITDGAGRALQMSYY